MTRREIEGQIEALLSPFDDILIAAADLAPGMTVVDLGCGTGSTAALAASQVAPDGRLVAVDASAEAIRRTRERLAPFGAAAATEQVDLDTGMAAGPWDRVLSRFVLMLIGDPVALLRRVRTHTSDSGRVLFMVWGRPEDNPWHTVPAAILTPDASSAHVNRPFALGTPDQLRQIATDAGFEPVEVTTHRVNLRVAQDIDAAVALAMADLRAAPGPRLANNLRAAIRDYTALDGTIEMPATALLLTAHPRAP